MSAKITHQEISISEMIWLSKTVLASSVKAFKYHASHLMKAVKIYGLMKVYTIKLNLVKMPRQTSKIFMSFFKIRM